MTTEALPEQEPTVDPEKTGRGGTENLPPARRPMFSLSRRALLKRFAYGLAALFTTAPGVLSVILYLQVNNMDIRIHSLEAALRSGQLSQLSSSVASLEKHVAERDERFALKEGVVSGMRTLGKTLDGQISDQNQKIDQKIEQLESKIDEQKRALQYELDGRQARALDFSSLKASFETLKASLVEKPPAASSGHAVSSEKNIRRLPQKSLIGQPERCHWLRRLS
ncbi:hypothetical protein PCO87_05215 [Pectobacteriaceae bacterium C52]|nr:hypothetical protein PCO87_05215 [Pectobacteriaceae bacterium C52]WJY11803.1 hypothetical protein PCO80_05190 [Pectobacteriaceae bacterium C80]